METARNWKHETEEKHSKCRTRKTMRRNNKTWKRNEILDQKLQDYHKRDSFFKCNRENTSPSPNSNVEAFWVKTSPSPVPSSPLPPLPTPLTLLFSALHQTELGFVPLFFFVLGQRSGYEWNWRGTFVLERDEALS